MKNNLFLFVLCGIVVPFLGQSKPSEHQGSVDQFSEEPAEEGMSDVQQRHASPERLAARKKRAAMGRCKLGLFGVVCAGLYGLKNFLGLEFFSKEDPPTQDVWRSDSILQEHNVNPYVLDCIERKIQFLKDDKDASLQSLAYLEKDREDILSGKYNLIDKQTLEENLFRIKNDIRETYECITQNERLRAKTENDCLKEYESWSIKTDRGEEDFENKM